MKIEYVIEELQAIANELRVKKMMHPEIEQCNMVVRFDGDFVYVDGDVIDYPIPFRAMNQYKEEEASNE